MNIFDFLDDWVTGPLNVLDRLERIVTGVRFRDMGYQLAILRCDKGGEFALFEVSQLLKKYGVAIYGRTHDANHIYFHVKKRQARWAEYLLLHAGVELHSPLFDQRNAGYAASHAPGWMPTPWSEKEERHHAEHDAEIEAEPPRRKSASLDSMIDRAFRWLD